ncbi:MAG: PspC domain-containing protein [Angelakisella sp.]
MAKKCYRLKEGRIVCGVCAGVAEYFNIDVLLVRIAWGALALCAGSGVLVYLIAAVALPER